MDESVAKTQVNFRASEETSNQVSSLMAWLHSDQTGVLARAVEELYNRELDRRQVALVEQIQEFARCYSTGKGELTPEETGYAKAMLTVARSLDYEFDDVTDALLDNIEFNKL